MGDDYTNSDLPIALPPMERWDLMFSELRSVLTSTDPTHPVSRVWRHSDLAGRISEIAHAHVVQLTTNFPPAREVIERMVHIGWAKPLPTLAPTGKKDEHLYLIDMEAPADELPGVPELLQGAEPGGVICYFGALELHELSTQLPAFYHIARLEDPRPLAPAVPAKPKSESTVPRKPRDPLGTLRFHYQGIPCYSTRRDRSLVPGIQLRQQGPRTLLRTTTLEQTLLDTLLHPLRCGGEATVLEAWERGIARWNPERMARHLEAIARDDFDRRTGAMLELLDASEEPALTPRMQAAKARWQHTADAEPIPLLHGLDYSRVSSGWGVTLP